MALGKAINFIHQFISDDEFRNECNSASSRQIILKKYDFTEPEFENAVNMTLVKCQTYDEALAVKEIKFWFMLL